MWKWLRRDRRKRDNEIDNDSKTPQTDSPKLTIDEQWDQLGIRIEEIESIKRILGYTLDPDRLKSVVFDLNKELANEGFIIIVAPQEALGILTDMEAINRKNRLIGKPPFNAIQVAIFREANKLVRQKDNIPLGAPIPEERITQCIDYLVDKAKKNTTRI